MSTKTKTYFLIIGDFKVVCPLARQQLLFASLHLTHKFYSSKVELGANEVTYPRWICEEQACSIAGSLAWVGAVASLSGRIAPGSWSRPLQGKRSLIKRWLTLVSRHHLFVGPFFLVFVAGVRLIHGRVVVHSCRLGLKLIIDTSTTI